MACLVKLGNKFENLSGYNTFINDTKPNSKYFKVSRFSETFTSGKNLFLMEGSECLKESTDIKIEITDVNKNTIYVEPGRGVPDYYEGNSVVLSAHIYDNIPVGPAKITILGELREYYDNDGVKREVPDEWKNIYNVKWEKDFYINKNILNTSPVIFYKKPVVTLTEQTGSITRQEIPTVTQTGSVIGSADTPPLGTDIRSWRAGTLYRLERASGIGFPGSIDENIIEVPSLNYQARVKEVLNSNTILVDTPYLIDNIVSSFPANNFTSTFENFDGRTTTETETTGSYQKLVLDNLDTFTGAVDTIRIFRKSRSDISDFKFLEELKISDISDEILLDETVQSHEKTGGFGRLTESNLLEYWDTSSIVVSGSESSVSFDDDLLFESLKINVPSSSLVNESIAITTQQDTTIVQNVDYQVSLRALVSGSFKDVIIGDTTFEYTPFSTDTYFLYDPTKLKSFPITFVSSSGYNDLLFQSSSRDVTKSLIYDDSRVTFYDTPQNPTGSTYLNINVNSTYDTNLSTNLTFDTTSADWGSSSRPQTDSTNAANIASVSSSFSGAEFTVNIWLDSGSYTIPNTSGEQNVRIYSEIYDSGSDSQLLIAFENIGGDAKFYHYGNSTSVDELNSFRDSKEYELSPIVVANYNDSSEVSGYTTGSQVIIDYISTDFNYINLDYRTKRSIEPLNAELITLNRVDRLNSDRLYGDAYTIDSMNFQTGRILFSDGIEASFSGTLSIQNGELQLELDGDTQTVYLVEADFNNDILVFVSRIILGEMEPDSLRYNTHDIFQLSGSTVNNSTTSSFVIPRVPTRAGDNLYTEAGYPLIGAEVSNRDFLTPIFDSPSSSLDITSPLDIPYVFRNNGSQITDVFTYDSSSNQIYTVSSLSSSADVNSDVFVYGSEIVQEGFVLSSSLNDSIYVAESDDVDTYQGLDTNLVNFTYKEHDFISGSIIISLLTDNGSTELPTNADSVEYYIETFVSESGEGTDVEIWRSALGLKNFDTDAMLYYNHSEVSQSAMDSYSGSINYELSTIDVSNFKSIPLRILETGSQAIIDVELSGSGYNYIYLDYRTLRNETPLNADLHDFGAVSSVNGSTILNDVPDAFGFSGSVVTSNISSSLITPRLPIKAGEYLYDNEVNYPFTETSASNGSYIGDTDSSTLRTYINDVYEIPYIFTKTDGKVNEVFVKRFDAIFTASSEYGTTGTSLTTSGFITESFKEPDVDVFKTIEVFFTGSSGSVDFEQIIISETASADYSSRQELSGIVTSEYTSIDTKFGIRVRGDGWQISNVKANPAKAQGFAPKTFKTIQEEKRNLADETFDYKFELYDVNNNYIPVNLNQTVRFTGGNTAEVVSGSLKIHRVQSNMTPETSSTYDIGSPVNRWRTVYTQNSVNISDINQKNNIIDTDLGLPFINSLRPVKYKWNNSETPRFHYGLVAQEVTSSLSKFGHTSDDVGFIYSASNELMLNYTELLSPMISAIKQLSEKVNKLEQKISGSN